MMASSGSGDESFDWGKRGSVDLGPALREISRVEDILQVIHVCEQSDQESTSLRAGLLQKVCSQ
jgi:hypothetical protein